MEKEAEGRSSMRGEVGGEEGAEGRRRRRRRERRGAPLSRRSKALSSVSIRGNSSRDGHLHKQIDRHIFRHTYIPLLRPIIEIKEKMQRQKTKCKTRL